MSLIFEIMLGIIAAYSFINFINDLFENPEMYFKIFKFIFSVIGILILIVVLYLWLLYGYGSSS